MEENQPIQVIITGQQITVDGGENPLYVGGSAGLYQITTSYDEFWDDATTRVVIFIGKPQNPQGECSIIRAVEDTGEAITIPAEVLAGAGIIQIGVIGYNADGTLKINTVPASAGSNELTVVRPIAYSPEEAAPDNYTPDIWTTLVNEIGDLSDLDTTDKSNLVAAINELAAGGGGGSGISSATATANSLDSDSDATASVEVDGSTLAFAFGIPRGEKGDKGDTGEQGPVGPQGPQGEAGSDATVTVDAELDSQSENPVQNKAIYAVIGNVEALLEDI